MIKTSLCLVLVSLSVREHLSLLSNIVLTFLFLLHPESMVHIRISMVAEFYSAENYGKGKPSFARNAFKHEIWKWRLADLSNKVFGNVSRGCRLGRLRVHWEVQQGGTPQLLSLGLAHFHLPTQFADVLPPNMKCFVRLRHRTVCLSLSACLPGIFMRSSQISSSSLELVASLILGKRFGWQFLYREKTEFHFRCLSFRWWKPVRVMLAFSRYLSDAVLNCLIFFCFVFVVYICFVLPFNVLFSSQASTFYFIFFHMQCFFIIFFNVKCWIQDFYWGWYTKFEAPTTFHSI